MGGHFSEGAWGICYWRRRRLSWLLGKPTGFLQWPPAYSHSRTQTQAFPGMFVFLLSSEEVGLLFFFFSVLLISFPCLKQKKGSVGLTRHTFSFPIESFEFFCVCSCLTFKSGWFWLTWHVFIKKIWQHRFGLLWKSETKVPPLHFSPLKGTALFHFPPTKG